MSRISIAEGLARLGVRRLLLAIHDVSFPSDPDEDTGRGSPATKAASRLFAYAKSLGFTGIQLGPQGQTSRSNPSPYDSTIFGRHVGNIATHSLRPGGALEGLVTQDQLDRALGFSRRPRGASDTSDPARVLTDRLVRLQHDLAEEQKALAIALGEEKRLHMQYSAAQAIGPDQGEVTAKDLLQRWKVQRSAVEAHENALRFLTRGIERAKSKISNGDASDSNKLLEQQFDEVQHLRIESRKRVDAAIAQGRELKTQARSAPRGTPEQDAIAAKLEQESIVYQQALEQLVEALRHNEDAIQTIERVYPEPTIETTAQGSAHDDADSRARHRDAYDAMQSLVETAWRAYRAKARPDLAAPFAAFRAANRSWLEREALYLAVCAENTGAGFRSWPERDRDLWLRGDPVIIGVLLEKHSDFVERHAFGQFLVHREHSRVRAEAERIGLALYGDLQVGYADADAWAYAPVFRRDYLMGAPPSRTNPEGQPWGYPVLDPAQYDGAARALVVARAEKAFAEYDSLRIDHPHGLICPWVYSAGDADPGSAVRSGARLFESPDLDDHPALAQFAIARADQIDRTQARHADRWVRGLDDEQVTRYSTLFDALVESARANGRDASDLSCEVLSTMPTPLEAVLARYDLGRWRITQKANLADPSDVYLADNARRQDWVMLGNHDTAPIFALVKTWPREKRDAWATHLAQRLALAQPERLADDGFLASAMLAELFLSRAENVSIFFADLFGIEERFNVPGLVDDANWTLRLPADFEALHAERLENHRAIDIALAVELALAAQR